MSLGSGGFPNLRLMIMEPALVGWAGPDRQPEGADEMSLIDKARNKIEEVVGEFKESVGEAYGNEALELDGEAEADAAREREAEGGSPAPVKQ